MADDLAALATSMPTYGSDEALARRLRRYLEQHPQLVHALAPLLDRGDPSGRELALPLAVLLRTPSIVVALRDFALGQRGPDGMRLQAAQAAVEAGALEAGPVRMWLVGEWRETLLFGFEILDQQLARLPPRVEELLGEALDELRHARAAPAEQLLRQALAVRPEEPSLLYNLAVAQTIQGREREAEAILRRLHERDREYFFARIGLAQLALQRGDAAAARGLVEPLLSRRRMHGSEFVALCGIEIGLQLGLGDRDGARRWFETLSQFDPEHPALDYWRSQIEGGPLKRRLGRALGREP
jgi:tetratricopeptide (TPR) repeat protein